MTPVPENPAAQPSITILRSPAVGGFPYVRSVPAPNPVRWNELSNVPSAAKANQFSLMDAEARKRAASSEEAAVDALIRSARLEVPLPNSFQSEVWRRIAAAQENSLSVRCASWMERLFGTLAHPATASGLVVALAAMGYWLGTVKEAPSPITKLAYVEAVSPFARTMPHSYEGEEP